MKSVFSIVLALSLLLAAAGPALAQPPAPVGAAAPLRDSVYIVQRGDTLYSIARRFNVSASVLIAANRIVNPNFIYIGQRLVIPGPGSSAGSGSSGGVTPPTTAATYSVQRGDTLYGIARRFNVSVAALMAANRIVNPNLIFVGQVLNIPGTGAPLPAGVPTATAAPGVPPTAIPPTAVPPTAVPPTAVPQPGGYTSSRGVRGEYFRLWNNTAGVNGDIWFEFAVTNTKDIRQYVGGLGAIIPGVWSQASWGDFTLGAHEFLDPDDHLNVPRKGTFVVYLGICWLASRTACENNLNSWDILSPGLTITIK